jgi:hypothetical protein
MRRQGFGAHVSPGDHKEYMKSRGPPENDDGFVAFGTHVAASTWP